MDITLSGSIGESVAEALDLELDVTDNYRIFINGGQTNILCTIKAVSAVGLRVRLTNEDYDTIIPWSSIAYFRDLPDE